MIVAVQQVHARADIGGVAGGRRVMGDKREVERALAVDTHAVLIGVASLVLAVERTGARALLHARARCVHPNIAGEAVALGGVDATLLVKP